ncbi:MAG: hypothetical protein PHE16_05440 [Aliarcobacter sp.]|nr:hypothetical protein [Aliarcobacter sp.]
MDFKNMTVPDILGLQDQLQKELNSRTNDLYSTILAITEIEKKAERTQNFFAKKIQNLKNKNEEFKELEKLGFTIYLYPHSRNIGIVNYQIKDKPDFYYGCEIDMENKEVVTSKNFYISLNDMSKIKEILKLI